MVKASDINKDIRSIAEKVGVAVFSYNDIHNKNIDNVFHYDYKRVIEECNRINGCDMTEELKAQGILKPMPYGEYAINVGATTRGGGGMNFGGTAFFTFSDDAYLVKYHELAHSLQDKYDLFNDEKLDMMYLHSSTNNEEKDQNKQMEREPYLHYLHEMHSESFSFAAMMLRAKNPLDFAKQSWRAFNSGVTRNAAALLDTRQKYTENPSSKYYATYPVMKETIKTIWKIRKEGKTGEFFDENGVLKDEKLARLSESIVMKSAYSPRTCLAMFKYRVADGHHNGEKGWRGDMLKSTAGLGAAAVLMAIDEGKSLSQMFYNGIKHSVLQYKEKKTLQAYLNSKETSSERRSPELKAMKDFSKLQFKLAQLDSKYPKEYISGRMEQYIKAGVIENGLPDEVINSASLLFGKYADPPSRALENDTREILTHINTLIKQNSGSVTFKTLVANNMDVTELHHLTVQKEKEPDKNVLEGLSSEVKEDFGFAHMHIKGELADLCNFADKWDKGGTLKQKLVTTLVNDPEKFSSPEFRKDIETVYGKNGNFKKDLKETCESMVRRHFMAKRSPEYMQALEGLRDVLAKDVPEEAHKRLLEERKESQQKSEARKAAKEQAQEAQSEENKTVSSDASEARKNGISEEEHIYGELKKLYEFGQKHDRSGLLAANLTRFYIAGDSSMCHMKFWGDFAKDYAHKSPEGKGEFLKDMAHLMPNVIKNIKEHENTPEYAEVKQALKPHATVARPLLKKAKELAENPLSQKHREERKTNKTLDAQIAIASNELSQQSSR